MLSEEQNKKYDLVIVGAGISGSALAWAASNYTNIKRIAVLEKNSKPAQVNSKSTNNSQTLQFGDIGTEHNLEQAKKVNRAANILKRYLQKHDPERSFHHPVHKMVLGIGREEIKLLEKKYDEFRTVFPKLQKLYGKEIARVEPKLVEGRAGNEELLALYSPDGWAVDFERLSEHFLNSARQSGKDVDVYFDTKVTDLLEKEETHYLKTTRGRFEAKAVEFAAGGYSLYFAHKLGLGLNLALISVAANLYFSPPVIRGKIYRLPRQKLPWPFTTTHGDPQSDGETVLFGVVPKIVFMLERRNYQSVIDYFKTISSWPKAILAVISILADHSMLKYIFQRRNFLKQVREMVPTLTSKELKFAKGYGGIRTQIIDLDARKVASGKNKLYGKRIIFNIAPLPGASMALADAEEDLKWLSGRGDDFKFYQEKFETDFAD